MPIVANGEIVVVFLLSRDRPSQRTAALWKTNPFNRAQLPETFKIADASGDGRIDKEEFRQLLGVNASQAELEKLFAQIDKDGDGELDLAEVRLVDARVTSLYSC